MLSREQHKLEWEECIRYKEADLNQNVFEFAKKYSSNDCNNNLFKIYSEEDALLPPGEKSLVAIIEYDPKIVILPNPIFYGTALKMETKINDSIMEIYVHNTSTSTYNNIPNYFQLKYLFENVFDYIGAAQYPIYRQKKNELIAIGIKSPYDFNLEDFCWKIFQNQNFITDPTETLQLFEDYKEWILNARNNRENTNLTGRVYIKQKN